MTALICVAGAVAGLIVAALANWLSLPMVLRSQERWLSTGWRPPLPALWGDPGRMRRITTAMYRYPMPLLFAAVGAMAAYQLFIAEGP